MERLQKLKIFVVGSGKHYANWMLGSLTDDIKQADLVVFTGGEDVTPSYYGDSQHPTTHNNPQRDAYEKSMFDKALALEIPMVGICRGSQFLCVMADGELVQHQENPLHVHEIQTHNAETYLTTSTHHQAQYPYNLPPNDYRLLAWTQGISRYHKAGDDSEKLKPNQKEAEVVYYAKINALGIQGHPEMMYDNPMYDASIKWFQGCLNKLVWGFWAKLCLHTRNLTV